jgi:hypothetical protein
VQVRSYTFLLISALLVLATACQSEDSSPGNAGFRIEIAPLGLEANTQVCYDLEVSGPGGVLWRRGDRETTFAGHDQSPPYDGTPGAPDTDALCSTQFGNGSLGSITFVGTCDASGDIDPDRPGTQNEIAIWVDGVYPGSPPPSDSTVSPERYGWQDPCPEGCRIEADCLENVDTPVEFNITLLRQLDRGFFVASTNAGNRIFCSASFSTCDGTAPNLLLTGRDADPDPTVALAIDCQVEPGANAPEFFFNAPVVTCTDADPTTTDSTFEIAMTCGAGISGSTSEGVQIEYLIGNEGLPSGCGVAPSPACVSALGSLAINLSTLPPGKECSLSIEAAVAEQGIFVSGEPPPATSLFPYITLTTPLTGPNGEFLCTRHQLNSNESPLKTVYRGPIAGPQDQIQPMCVSFDAGDAAMSNTGACPPVQCEEFVRASCSDGVMNGDETGTDCGGSCGLCPAGERCITGTDCLSGSCSQDTFECAPPAVADGVVVEPGGWYRQWSDGTFASSCAAYKTGDAVHQYAGQIGSGRYRIQPTEQHTPFDVYCDMTSAGGGWTLAMKLDGQETTFAFGATYWTTPALYHPEALWFDDEESKSEAFNTVPFSELRLGMTVGNVTNWIELPTPATPSLLAAFANPALTPTSVGRDAWKGLVTDASLQSNCSREGFNAVCDGADPSRVRIGIVGNNENDCTSCDSRLGFGGASGAGGQDAGNSCGNEAYFDADGGDRSIRAFGYVFVR